MIIEALHGLDAQHEQGLLGCPYHGIAEGGVLTMQSGKQVNYPVTMPHWDVPYPIVDSKVIAPPWAKAKPMPEPMRSQGMALAPYAIINGAWNSIYGVDLGMKKWLWAEAPGKVWLVDASELDDPFELDGKVFHVHLTRFGWFGGTPPDGQLHRTIAIRHFDLVTHRLDSGSIPEVPYLQKRPIKSEDQYGPNQYQAHLYQALEFGYALEDTHPVDGHCALLTVRTWKSIFAIVLLDLLEEKLTLLYGCDYGFRYGYGKNTNKFINDGSHTELFIQDQFVNLLGAGFSAEGKPKAIITRMFYTKKDVTDIDTSRNWHGDAAISIDERIYVQIASMDGDIYHELTATAHATGTIVWDEDRGNWFITPGSYRAGTGFFDDSFYHQFAENAGTIAIYELWTCDCLYNYNIEFPKELAFFRPSNEDAYAIGHIRLSSNIIAVAKYTSGNNVEIIGAVRCGRENLQRFDPPIKGSYGNGPGTWQFATFSSDPITGDILVGPPDQVKYRV